MVLIGVGTSILRLSSDGPPAALTASAMSAVETAPKRRPPVPACAVTVTALDSRLPLMDLRLLEGLHLADLAALGDRVDLLLAALGPRRRETATEEEVAGVAVLDVDDVTGGAEAGDLVGEDDLHRVWLLLEPVSGTSSSTAAGPSRGRS